MLFIQRACCGRRAVSTCYPKLTWLNPPKPGCRCSGQYVRFGSKADIPPVIFYVRFTPKSGHWMLSFPLRANSRSSIRSHRRRELARFLLGRRRIKSFGFYGRQTGPSVFDFYADHYDCLCRSQPDKARKAITDSGANSGCIRVKLGRPIKEKKDWLLYCTTCGAAVADSIGRCAASEIATLSALAKQP